MGGEDGDWENRDFVIEGRDDKIKIREFKLAVEENVTKGPRMAEKGLAPVLAVAGK